MTFCIIAIIVLLIGMITGLPIFVAVLLSAMVMVAGGGYDPSFFAVKGFTNLDSITMLAMPMFIFAGSLMEHGGIGDKLLGACYQVIGSIKGGLGAVVPISSAVFGAITGSSTATVSCIGSIAAPKLKENGYPDGVIGSVIASAGVLGVLIPPSMLVIYYGWLGNESVLKCFLSTLLPGVLLTLLMAIVTILLVKTNPNIKVLDRAAERAAKMAMTAEEKRAAKYGPDGKRQFGSLPALLLPVVVLGGIYSGVFTTVEAAAISCLYATVVGIFIYRGLDPKEFVVSIKRAGVVSGIIMVSVYATGVLSRMFITEGLPMAMLNALMKISENPKVIMLLINVFMVFMGMIMSDTSCMLLLTPILVPIVKAIGYSPIHFCAIMCVNIGMGNVTPPVAPNLYLAASIAKVDVKDMMVPNIIYVLTCWLPVLIITTLFPQIALWLPGQLGG